VVPHLRRVVESGSRLAPRPSGLDDLFDGLVLEVGALDLAVEVGDVGAVVLSPVELHVVLRDLGLEGVLRRGGCLFELCRGEEGERGRERRLRNEVEKKKKKRKRKNQGANGGRSTKKLASIVPSSAPHRRPHRAFFDRKPTMRRI